MTLEEQRAKLIEMMCKARYEHGLVDNECAGKWETVARTFKEMWRARESAVLAALSAAGFSIVGPEVTEEMITEGERWGARRDLVAVIFKAMLAAGDLGKAK